MVDQIQRSTPFIHLKAIDFIIYFVISFIRIPVDAYLEKVILLVVVARHQHIINIDIFTERNRKSNADACILQQARYESRVHDLFWKR